MKKTILLMLTALAALLPLLTAQAQDKGKHTTLQEEEAQMRAWIQTLGSDAFGGRMPMTEYETKTIHYLAGEMKAL
ncbi:MAG: hypothetical protein II580_08715, partial [Bacteroidales bacterium]|nr:hypothetical protein [Bacteroidales bacterium]